MRTTRPLEQALRLAAPRPTTSAYVCHSCRAQAAAPRQLHTTPALAADSSFYQRMKESLFGSKESTAAAASREEKQSRRLTELAERQNTTDGSALAASLETKTDKHGRTYEIAEVVDPATRSDYVQATTWQGLDSVGGVEWVRKRADKGEAYAGFAPQSDQGVRFRAAHWEMLLHHITVEAVVLQRARRDATQICLPRAETDSWMLTRGAILTYSTEAGIEVKFPDRNAEKRLRSSIPLKLSEGLDVQTAESLSLQLQGAIADAPLDRAGKPAWMSMPLDDNKLKLAISKRILQLTGRRLPDPVISKSPTLGHIYHALQAKPVPKRLAQKPQLKRLQVYVPNATVHNTRQTPIHKDKEVGRWKVIESELVSRGLPVTGSTFQGAKAGVY